MYDSCLVHSPHPSSHSHLNACDTQPHTLLVFLSSMRPINYVMQSRVAALEREVEEIDFARR